MPTKIASPTTGKSQSILRCYGLRTAHAVIRTYALFILTILLTACNLPVNPSASSLPLNLVTVDPNATATPTPFQPAVQSFTPSPTSTLFPTLTPIPTETATATPTLSPTFTATTVPATLSPASTRPQYTFYVLLDYYGYQLAVDQTIQYTNLTGTTLSDLVLAVEPNLTADSFSLETLFLDGASVNYALEGHRLTIYLPQQLTPGGAITL